MTAALTDLLSDEPRIRRDDDSRGNEDRPGATPDGEQRDGDWPENVKLHIVVLLVANHWKRQDDRGRRKHTPLSISNTSHQEHSCYTETEKQQDDVCDRPVFNPDDG